MKLPLFVVTVSALAVSVLPAASVADAAGAGPATQPSITRLAGFGGLLADPAHGRVYVSEGAANQLAVTDSAGAILETVGDLPGAGDLALTPDGGTLYVAVTDAIAAVDTSTYDVTVFPTGVDTCPAEIAYSAGTVWFGEGCDAGSASLGALDPSTGTVALGLLGADWHGGSPHLAADALHLDGALFVGAPTEPAVLRYDVKGGSTPTITLSAQLELSNPVEAMALNPDGSQLGVVPTSSAMGPRLDTGDLSRLGTFRLGGENPTGLAYRSDGMLATSAAGTPNVFVLMPGYTGWFRTYILAGGLPINEGRLAFGNTNLYVVTGAGSHTALRVFVPKRNTNISVRTNKVIYAYGELATITAHLGDTGVSRTVTIGATSYGGSYHVVRRARVDANGNLVAHLRVFKRTTFVASFAGDKLSNPASAQSVHPVRAHVANALQRFYGQSGPWHLYHTNIDPYLLATVLPKTPGACVYFRGQYLHDGRWETFGKTPCVHLNSLSKAAVILNGTHYVGEQDRLRAEWLATPANAGAVGPWQLIRFTGSAKSAGVPTPASGETFGRTLRVTH